MKKKCTIHVNKTSKQNEKKEKRKNYFTFIYHIDLFYCSQSMLTVPCIYYFYFSIPNPKIEDVIFFNSEMSLHCLTNDGQEKNCHLTIYDMIRQLMTLGPIHIWVWLILPIDFLFFFFIFFFPF